MKTRQPCLGRSRLLPFLFIMAATVATPRAMAQQPDDRTLIYRNDGLELRWHLQGGVNAVSERNLFWNFSNTVAPEADFDPDTDWLEMYVKPGISFDRSLRRGHRLYGKLSSVASYTAGIDAFDAGNTGRVTLEEGYIGFLTATNGMPAIDISVGPRELVLGSGMLIANGGASGFERGALKFGPRKAWKQAAIGKLVDDVASVTAFYLAPNELPSTSGHNKLAGLDLRHDAPQGGYLGLSYIHVLRSESVYPKAAPGGRGPPSIVPDGRDGTNALNAYAKSSPFKGAFKNAFVTGDLAYEWNDRIDMEAWAGRVQLGYAFEKFAWNPTLTYSFQTFSGDDPNTSRLERFDPLYYEGSPGAWATGSKSSMVFINSNVQSQEIAISVHPTKRDTLTLRYAYIRANELNSPLQFGQATRIETTGGTANIVTGVDNAHLSDDVFLEYNRVINRNTYLTAGLSVSFPGKGIRDVVDGDAPNWVGGFVNVVVNF